MKSNTLRTYGCCSPGLDKKPKGLWHLPDLFSVWTVCHFYVFIYNLETEDGKENPKLRRALQRGRSRSMIIGDQGEGGTEGIQRRKKSTKNCLQIDLWHSPEPHNRNYHVFLLYPSIWRFKRKTNIRNETEEKIITIESWSAAVAGAQTQVQVPGSDGEAKWQKEKRKPRERRERRKGRERSDLKKQKKTIQKCT